MKYVIDKLYERYFRVDSKKKFNLAKNVILNVIIILLQKLENLLLIVIYRLRG